MLALVINIVLHHLPFLALLLSPHLWSSLSIYHEQATISITQKWQQLQLAVQIQTPPPTIASEDGDDSEDDEYEQWVDGEIKRFQCVLGEIETIEDELRGMREVAALVGRTRRWIEGLWVVL